MVSHVACFEDSAGKNLPLQSERPFMRLLRSKVRGDAGVIEGPWIKHAAHQSGSQIGTIVRPGGVGKQGVCANRGGSGRESLQEDDGGRARDVQVDVVKRRVIRQAIAAAYNGFPVAPHEGIVGGPSETNARSPAVLGGGNGRKDGG